MKSKLQTLTSLFFFLMITVTWGDVKTNLKRQSMTNGEVTFITGKQVRFLHRAFPDCDLLGKIGAVTFVTDKQQWLTIPYPEDAPVLLEENGLKGFKVTKKSSFGEITVKIFMPQAGPFVLLRFTYKNQQPVSSLRGSLPSLDFPEEFIKFAIDDQEREAAKLLQDGKHMNVNIKKYAAFSTEDAAQPAVLMVIPELSFLDFTADAKIVAGGCKRGYGWFPGGNVSHSDFIENDLGEGDEVSMDVILAVALPEQKYADIAATAVQFYKSTIKAKK